MDRDEILSKVKKSKEPDEMQLSIMTKALGISSIIVPVMCLICVLIRIFNGERAFYDLIAITFIQLFVSEYYKYLEQKNKKQLIKCIIILFVGFGAFFKFIYELIYYAPYSYPLSSFVNMLINSGGSGW